MPAVVDFRLDITRPPVVYPARLHGAACTLFGHPATGKRPKFATRPLEGHGRQAQWRVGWLGTTPCPRAFQSVLFGDTTHDVLGVDIHERSYGDLAAGPPTRRADIEVLSPMFFSRGDRDHPAPDAVLALRSLADRWDAHAPDALHVPPEDRAALLASVYLVGMDGHTVTGAVGSSTNQTGYVGTMTLALTRQATGPTAALFGALLRFAEIAGIGAQTGHGFGATRVHPRQRATRTDHRGDTQNRRGPRNPVLAAQGR